MEERPEVDAFLADAISAPLVRMAVRHAAEGLIVATTRVRDAKREDVARARSLGCAHVRAFTLWHTHDGARMRVCPTCARCVFDSCPKP